MSGSNTPISVRVGDTYLEYGCYGDASLGRAHIRAKLAELVLDLCCEEDVIVSLYGDAPDDAWDEREALDLLNQVTGADGYWELDEGDLCLTHYPEDGEDEVAQSWPSERGGEPQ